ncbi:MAG: hypothetical protein WC080_04455 [Patescibacteria group bacterium]|jgi:broad specificity phosphatase PhoE
MSEIPNFNAENETLRKYGSDVKIRNYWNRHAQKQSGEVIVAGALSKSSISEQGASKAKELGGGIEASQHGAKAYVSESPRTRETAESILNGYQESNPDVPIRNIAIREQLTLNFPKEFLELYDKKFTESRAKLMQEMGLDPDNFKSLPPDEQEKIAEKAEEPILAEWLSGQTDLSQLQSPEMAAYNFAQLFNRRHNRMASKLYSGSEIDLFHISHRGIMEPFLTSGILIDEEGQRVNNIDQLGGSLAILEGWESEVDTDSDGNATISVILRNKRYSVDNDVLHQLVEGKNE